MAPTRCAPMALALALLATAALGAGCSEPASGADAGLSGPDAAPAARDAGEACPDCDAGAADARRADAGRTEVLIRSVLPSRGPLAGGTSVTIEGGGFYQGFAEGSTDAKKQTRVFFGKNEVARLDIIDDDTMEVVAPPNPGGPADVIVQNPNGTATCQGCFGYFLELSFASLAPASGPLEGGFEVDLAGAAFSPGLTVLFGGRASPRVTLVDDRQARAVVPPGAAAGAVDVRVFNKNGVGEIRRGFTYLSPLRIDRVEPPYGPLAGGGTALVRGSALGAAARVRFGVAEASFAVLDDATLSVLVPAGAAVGAVDVAIETPTRTARLAAGYVYFDPAAAGPSLAGLWPTHGPAAGGTAITLVGSGLDGVASFEIGGVAAAVVGTPSANVAVVTAPAGPANAWVPVAAGGAILAAGYHYNVALASVAPASGASTGGEPFALAGAGFVDGLEVRLGALPATAVSVTDATTLRGTTPPGAGACDVRVSDPADPLNEAVLPGAFTFQEPVSVGRVSPDTGAIAGGTYVAVLGTGFGPGVAVLFGGTPLKDLQVVDAHTIVGHTPPGRIGAVDVAVERAGAKDVSPGAFSYFDPTNGGGGSSGGPLNGTLNVTVLESSWLRYGQPVPGATVMLGIDPSTPFQGKTDRRGQITFSDPSLAKAQTVTVYKDGYQPLTVARQESQNLTVYLGNSQGDLGPPDMPEPTTGSGPALISGHVTGFKLPRPLRPHETAWAEVWIASSSLYSTPPFGYRAGPDVRDARGERWKLTRDGAAYTVFTSAGLRAVYAVYGIYDKQQRTWTPVLLGVRRGVNADPNRPAIGKDIVLDVHLDQTVKIHFEQPAYSPLFHRMAHTDVYGWFELGAEGVIPMGRVGADAPDVPFGSLPRVDGDSLIFYALASDAEDGPTSSAFRKQLGDLSRSGLTFGPMLSLPQVTAPADEGFDGTIRWQLSDAPDAEIARLSVARLSATSGYSAVWSAILPGTERAIALPQNLTDDLLATSGPDDQLAISLSFARSARFDYAHWSYTSLATDTWTAWAEASVTVPVFAPQPPPPPP